MEPLTREEKNLLDLLYERWKEAAAKSNLDLLRALYGSKGKGLQNHALFEVIELKILKQDFVGSGKIFADVFELFKNIIPKITYMDLVGATLITERGTIIIIHKRGDVKPVVFSVIRKDGRRRTYKTYGGLNQLKDELTRRENGKMHAVPFTKMVATSADEGRAKKNAGPNFSIEEYGGVDLSILEDMATRDEARMFTRIMNRFQIFDTLQNYTYDPLTKKLYRVDPQ